MHLSRAFGLGIQSSLALPELLPSVGTVDVQVRFGKLHAVHPAQRDSPYFFHLTERETYLYFENATFLVRDGREVIVDAAASAEDQVLRLYLLGSVMAALLHQRGCLALHASGVAIHGRAAAFLGASGQGKSTIAAMLHRRSHPFIADDVIAVSGKEDDGPPRVLPGFPRLKLWPDTLEAFGENPDALARVHPSEEKRASQANNGFTSEARPLNRLYILTDGPSPCIERIGPQEAVLLLIRHTYRIDLLPFDKSPVHFCQCANLANHVPVSRLITPRSFDRLPEVASLVEADMLST